MRLLTRRQLLDGGITPAQIRWRAGRHWRVVLPGIYQLDRAATTRGQREVAGLLATAPHGVLGGLTAARRWGVGAADPGDVVHILVRPPRVSRRVAWLHVQRTTIEDPGETEREGLRLSSPARAVLDAAIQCRSADTAAAIAIEAVQRRLVTVDDLVEALDRLNRRGSHLARSALAAASSGAWSQPEATLLRALADSPRLPQAWANPTLSIGRTRLTSPDVWIDEAALAVMVHSRKYHSHGLDWDATVEQDSDLTAAGVVVVGVTPNAIHSRLPDVVRRIERAYAVARNRPRPPVVATRRSLFAASPA